MVEYDYIRELFFNKGLSKRAIAKQLMIHRNTVTRALESNDNRYTLTVDKDKPINGDFVDRIKVMIQENNQVRKKDRLTKTRMHLSIAFKLDQQCTLLDHPVPKNRPMIAN